MSSGRRRALRVAYAVIAFGAALALIFALYVYRVRTSPFMSDLERNGAGYPCIGERLFPERRNERPALHIARRYLLEGESRAPSPGWHFEYAVTTLAVEAAFGKHEVNRMYAALPISRYRDFDDVALTAAGRRFCDLDEAQREVVREFSRTGRHEKLRALLAAGGTA